ncbi:hypothetical protein ACLI4Z_11760 [Natrialbaceae archaeon A-arb3/5]
MTGFKSGASADDPFSDGIDDESDATATAASTPDVEETDSDSAGHTDHESSTDAKQTSDAAIDHNGLPWIYERNSITDGRRKTVQLHLQQTSLDRERDARLDVEDSLGESVKKADLREAALLVGLDHIDEVATQLREWGYDFD